MIVQTTRNTINNNSKIVRFLYFYIVKKINCNEFVLLYDIDGMMIDIENLTEELLTFFN
jgi:hypothetical protein